VPPSHELANDEVFGPVLAVLPFDNEADGIKIANATQFGLFGRLWTRRAANESRPGFCQRLRRSRRRDRAAIGGMKKSGHGREKGFEALYEFSILRTTTVKHD
jgi:aldehyde dehydrogenase (NAD+)